MPGEAETPGGLNQEAFGPQTDLRVFTDQPILFFKVSLLPSTGCGTTHRVPAVGVFTS